MNFSPELVNDIFNTFGLIISESTIRKYRYKMGYRFRTLRKAPILTPAIILERYIWCLKNLNNKFLFINFVYADECKIEINNWRTKHLRKKTKTPCCAIQNHQQRLHVNVWGAISWEGASSFVV